MFEVLVPHRILFVQEIDVPKRMLLCGCCQIHLHEHFLSRRASSSPNNWSRSTALLNLQHRTQQKLVLMINDSTFSFCVNTQIPLLSQGARLYLKPILDWSSIIIDPHPFSR